MRDSNIATHLSDMITPKQIGYIRALCRDKNVDHESECRSIMNCSVSELSKRAASDFIDHVKDLPTPPLTYGRWAR